MLSSRLWPGIPSGFFRFSCQNSVRISLSTMHVTCLAHLALFGLRILIGHE
jgi:hypothetical protein